MLNIVSSNFLCTLLEAAGAVLERGMMFVCTTVILDGKTHVMWAETGDGGDIEELYYPEFAVITSTLDPSLVSESADWGLMDGASVTPN